MNCPRCASSNDDLAKVCSSCGVALSGEPDEKSGKSRFALVSVLVIGTVIVAGLISAVAIPAYEDYTVRISVAEAVGFGKSASEVVTNYYYKQKQVPSSLEQAGFAQARPDSVKAIDVNGRNGTVSITLAAAPVQGKDVMLVPSLDAENHVKWKCSSMDVRSKFLPEECREQR